MVAPVPQGIAFVFGGCCGSVISLEALVTEKGSNGGKLVTFAQFVFVVLMKFREFIEFPANSRFPRFKKLHAPLKVYILSVILFYLSSVGNNSVFRYDISIPIHITFRCFGTVITMVTCYLLIGRRYSRLQVFSTVFLTFGAIIASLYKDKEFSFSDDTFSVDYSGTNSKFLTGITILALSSFLTSLLSVYNEWTYNTYGKYWRENLFYSHLLSLPLFFFDYVTLKEEMGKILYAPSGLQIPIPFYEEKNIFITTKLMTLFANLFSQYVCISGVNLLASQTGALTLSIILLVRKFVSLLLSVILFHNKLSFTAYFGIIIVFFGAFLYTMGSKRKPEANNNNNNNNRNYDDNNKNKKHNKKSIGEED